MIRPGTAVPVRTLTADFVIDGSGEVVAVHYGRHIGDHMRVEDMVALRRRGAIAAGGKV